MTLTVDWPALIRQRRKSCPGRCGRDALRFFLRHQETLQAFLNYLLAQPEGFVIAFKDELVPRMRSVGFGLNNNHTAELRRLLVLADPRVAARLQRKPRPYPGGAGPWGPSGIDFFDTTRFPIRDDPKWRQACRRLRDDGRLLEVFEAKLSAILASYLAGDIPRPSIKDALQSTRSAAGVCFSNSLTASFERLLICLHPEYAVLSVRERRLPIKPEIDAACFELDLDFPEF